MKVDATVKQENIQLHKMSRNNLHALLNYRQ